MGIVVTTRCPHCREKLRSDATRCPHCTQPVEPRGTIPWWVIIAIALVVLVAFANA